MGEDICTYRDKYISERQSGINKYHLTLLPNSCDHEAGFVVVSTLPAKTITLKTSSPGRNIALPRRGAEEREGKKGGAA